MKLTGAIAKVAKYAVRNSGDSADVVERPLGGLSALVVDGQGSGKLAKTQSTSLAGRAASLINDGIRDGAVARAVHDWLHAQKHGRVSAAMTILSLATDTNTLVVTRSGNCPAFVFTPTRAEKFTIATNPLGFYQYTRPQVDQVDLEEGLLCITFSDGVCTAGQRRDRALDSTGWFSLISTWYKQIKTPGQMAEKILQHALDLDDRKPQDDMTVMVLGIIPSPADGIRRLQVEYPME